MKQPIDFLWTATTGADAACFVYFWGLARWVRIDATHEQRTPRTLLRHLAWILGGPGQRWGGAPIDLERALAGGPVVRPLVPREAMTLDQLVLPPPGFVEFLERTRADVPHRDRTRPTSSPDASAGATGAERLWPQRERAGG